MLIRKLFKFEGSHVVRNCTTKRCSENIHGHSYKVEFLLKGHALDYGGMIVDFGLLKQTLGKLVDLLDHTHIFWNKESENIKSFYKENFSRWIETNFSPSAESLAIFLFQFADEILKKTEFSNGEKYVDLDSVIVHETETGYAQAFKNDNQFEAAIVLSPELQEEGDFLTYPQYIYTQPAHQIPMYNE